MTKNGNGLDVTVLDENGRVIGLTYPKRARGLVKKGRAVYSDGCTYPDESSEQGSDTEQVRPTTIILTSPNEYPKPDETIEKFEKTEDIQMDNVNILDFNAKDFVKTCAPAERFTVTNRLGNAETLYQLGTWQWEWSQIQCSLTLEPNADYIYRFAVRGGVCDTADAILRFCIFYGEFEEGVDWDEKYLLDHSEFAPKLSKKQGGDLLRIFEIPLRTDERGKVEIAICAQHAVASIMTAEADEIYEELEDISYWDYQNRNIESASEDCSCSYTDIDLQGAHIGEKMLTKILEKVRGNLGDIDLSGAFISQDDKDDED